MVTGVIVLRRYDFSPPLARRWHDCISAPYGVSNDATGVR